MIVVHSLVQILGSIAESVVKAVGGRRRSVEKSKSRISHLAWKSRKCRGISTPSTAPAATSISLVLPFKKK